MSELGKNEGHDNDVLKTSLNGTFTRGSDSDVFLCFQIEPNVRTFLVRMSNVRWRNRKKRDDKEHHEKLSFFNLPEF